MNILIYIYIYIYKLLWKMEHTIELNDTPILCIICLEDLDIDIMEVCDIQHDILY